MSMRELADWELKPSGMGGGSTRLSAPGQQYSSHMYQRVIVKAEYIKTDEKPKALGALQKYLERDGDCKEKFLSPEGGIRYITRDGEQLFGSGRELDEWKSEGRFWHIVVSPEASYRLSTSELRRFTGRLVARWEKELGHRLEYKAAIHADSTRASGREPQPHIHLLVRGTIEVRGQRMLFRIPERTISHTFRGNARELATQMWGMRTMQDREKAWSDQVEARRPTRLDLRIAEKSARDAVAPEKLDKYERARAAFLVREGHARHDLLGRIKLEPQYTDKLDAWRKSEDRMQQRAQEARER